MKKKLPPPVNPFDEGLLLEGFRAYEIGTGNKDIPDYVRRDFYKVCVTDGDFIITYDSGVTVSSGNILFFGSPMIPYTCQALAPSFKGYACVFTAAFLKKNDLSLDPEQYGLFSGGTIPIISLTREKNRQVREIFKKMITESKGNYIMRDEVIRMQIVSLLHFAQMQE